MIENTERGVTLNKQFAYTLLVGLVGAGFWVGVTVSTLSGKIDNLIEKENARAVQVTVLENRLNLLERTESASSANMRNLMQTVTELKQAVDQLNRRLVADALRE